MGKRISTQAPQAPLDIAELLTPQEQAARQDAIAQELANAEELKAKAEELKVLHEAIKAQEQALPVVEPKPVKTSKVLVVDLATWWSEELRKAHNSLALAKARLALNPQVEEFQLSAAAASKKLRSLQADQVSNYHALPARKAVKKESNGIQAIKDGVSLMRMVVEDWAKKTRTNISSWNSRKIRIKGRELAGITQPELQKQLDLQRKLDSIV
jgi:hypothetical protein